MTTRSTDGSSALAQDPALHPSSHTLYDPATHTAWAWGPTAADARQRAEAHMRELDARLAPSPDDESVAEHLDRCAVMPLVVPQRFVLDLLALLELSGDARSCP